jgi:cellulose synthase (UDP-forming)
MKPLSAKHRPWVFAVYIAATLLYLGWRVVDTLNPRAPLSSGVFFALEVYAAACAVAFYLIVSRRRRRQAPPTVAGLSVDVFICTYNESLDLVRQTIRRAMAMDYPHQTWLLDDGRRVEARLLAEELGCRYLTRSENTHYKAGNLNHALTHSTADLVMVLDADHLVSRRFLTRLVGYFANPRVALVQTPQVFYNVDSFQHHLDAPRWRMWHEGAIFHHAMQPGADRWGAAFFVGTGAILRRAALDHVGGFATESVTEDAFTSMRLHAAGYTSVYHDEPLAYLLAPDSLLQYLTQRLRWGQGSMQILRLDNPLTKRGLSWRQRLVYFAALSSFSQALVHLAYYIAPALFLLGGPAPLYLEHPAQLIPILVHFAIDVLMFKLFLGPLGRPLLAECFKFVNVYAFLKSLSGYFSSKRLAFAVTPKGRDTGASLRLLLPQIALFSLNLAAFGHGLIELAFNRASAMHALGIGVATFFAGMFCVVGAMTLLYSHERIASKSEYAFPDHIDATFASVGSATCSAVVVRANEESLHVVMARRPEGLHPGATAEVELELEDAMAPLCVRGTVEAVRVAQPEWVVHLAIVGLTQQERDRLHDRFAEHAMPKTVDALVRPWSVTTSGTPDAEDERYYLPMETTVL